MAFTASRAQRHGDRPKQTQLAGQDLIRIRTLYLERRYKQCISLCTDLVNPDLHPVHEAFQLFHQAICYEALGLAAHNYSRNKIPFLDSAKENFATALDALPQPFATDEVGRYDTPKPSPFATTFIGAEHPDEARDDSPGFVPVPSIQVSSRTRTPSEASSHYSSSASSSVSDTYTVPDFDRYSPRPKFLTAPKSIPRTVTFPDVQKQDLETDDDEAYDSEADADSTPRKPSHQNRLSACLSSKHVLADDLVPSPLFSRTKKTAQIPYRPVAAEDTITDGEGTPAATQPPRPLPRTPYTHRTHHTLLPARRTAVQTLISKYEQTLPSPNTPSSYTTATPPASASTPNTTVIATPATARFAAIASVFGPRPQTVSTVTPTPDLTISQYLSSHTLARYNACLSSFRTSLLVSVSRIDTLIGEAHEIQERHARERQEAAMRDAQHNGGIGKARLRSMWLLNTPADASPLASRSSRVGKAETNHARPQRLRLSATNRATESDSTSSSPTETSPATPVTTFTAPVGPSPTNIKTRLIDKLPQLRTSDDATRKRERMEKLRARGFAVRKERYGWKGARHYEDMRRRVERELGG